MFPRLIALDLDGTLLNSKKELTARNDAALRRAHELGAEIVVATGRFFEALPEHLRTLPYVRYFLSVNGAEVYDRETNSVLYRAEIPWQQAIEIMDYFDTLPVIYDCYMDDKAWMSAPMREVAVQYAWNEFYVGMMQMRRPVPDLKEFLRQTQMGVQKTMCLFLPEKMELRRELLQKLPGKFPNTVVTTSIPNNIEFNHKDATKAAGMLALAKQLGIAREETMAFGDDFNDISMLQAAGVGVAMANAFEEIQKAADVVTTDCDHDGVAAMLEPLFS